MHRVLRLPFTLTALAAAVLFVPLPGESTPTVHQVTVNMTQYEFTPARLEVDQGDEVVITLTSSDVVHGFYLDGYAIEKRVLPGVSEEIRFTADRPGKFRYRCSVSCGTLHPFMIGELVVRPNLPFWRGALLMVAAVGVFFVSLARRKEESVEQITPA